MVLGGPELAFSLRYNLSGRLVCGLMDFISLATACALLYRVRPMPHTAQMFLAAACTGFLANIAWRHHCRHAVNGGSHTRWREVPAALFRLSGFGFGAGCVLIKGFLDQVLPADASKGEWAAVGWHAALLVLASIVPSLWLLWLARPVRIWIALPVQLALTLDCAKHNAATCGAAALALGEPTGQRLMQDAFQLLSTLRYSIYPPGVDTRFTAVTQCGILLTYMQLSLGFAVPALLQAGLEIRAFVQHQLERRQHGLPPERGLQAWLYASIAGVFQVMDGPVVLLILRMLLGILWDTSVLLCAGRLPRAL